MRLSDQRSWNLLLISAAMYCLGMGLAGSLVGMFVGWHILAAALGHLLVGIGFAIWWLRRGTH
ncbi:MAG: hypothetical protein FD138_2182 [Planctomycetota bacterium]|nr:MAG: hypothetical protein FD138_2182 [Planctomycetota bacterium]